MAQALEVGQPDDLDLLRRQGPDQGRQAPGVEPLQRPLVPIPLLVLGVRLVRQLHFIETLTDEADAEDEQGDGHQRTLERLDAGRLTALVGALPAEQVQVIRLAYFEGLSHAEVGKVLEVPLGTVKSRLRLALAKLRSAMG